MPSKKEKIKILHLSTHDEECGIGKFQESFLHYMATNPDVSNEFYPPSLNHLKRLTGTQLGDALNDFRQALEHFDILHIQHEFGLFSGDGEGLSQFVDIAKSLNKKLIITIHTAPGLILKDNSLQNYTIRGVAGYLKRVTINRRIIAKRLKPFKKADLVITLNSFTAHQLTDIVGVSADKIFNSQIPIPTLTELPKNNVLRKKMDLKTGDILLCTHGFITPYKGVKDAIQALSMLSQKYKLAILGGTNPDSGDPRVYEEVVELVRELKLEKRVYISGYIKNDNKLDELLRGCDIALYPYNLEYYKLASSAAITKAITNKLPVVAFPTQSFIEINAFMPGSIVLTDSAEANQLAEAVEGLDIEDQTKKSIAYAKANSYSSSAQQLIGLYKKLLARG